MTLMPRMPVFCTQCGRPTRKAKLALCRPCYRRIADGGAAAVTLYYGGRRTR